MLKSGLLNGVLAFLLMTLIPLVFLGTPNCCPFLIAPLAGVLAGWFDKPAAPRNALLSGAVAGALGGAGATLGVFVGTFLKLQVAAPLGLYDFFQEQGWELLVPALGGRLDTILLGNCYCSLYNILLTTGLGALSALVVQQIQTRAVRPGPG